CSRRTTSSPRGARPATRTGARRTAFRAGSGLSPRSGWRDYACSSNILGRVRVRGLEGDTATAGGARRVQPRPAYLYQRGSGGGLPNRNYREGRMESTNGFSVEYWGRLGLPNRDVGAPQVQSQGQASAGCLTLPTDSAERKKYPLLRGLLNYFPAALARVSRISYEGNEKHNP